MRIRTLVLALLLGAGIGLAAPPAGADRIEKLIADLGSAKFEEREKASRELETLGKAALEALRKAAKSGDPETRRRAGEIVRRIEDRQNSERALAAGKVRWKFKDTPILEAIQEIHLKTGFLISYVDDPEKLKGRTVTLDTGETTFWQAFDQFCQKAGVKEGQAPPNLNVPAAGAAGGVQPAAARLAAKPVPANAVAPAFGAYRHVSLVDGKPGPLPTDYVGVMRVRVLPPEMELWNGPPKLDKEVRLLLDLSPEPKVDFQRVLELRVDQAVDEKGQSLAALKAAVANPNAAVLAAAGATGQRALGRQMPLRLEAAAQPSRTLKGLKGAVLASLRTPPQVMASVENLLNASGKSVKGEYGVTLTVREVKKHNDGGVELHVTLERPSEVYAYLHPTSAGGIGPPVRGGQIQIQPAPAQGRIQIRPAQIKPIQLPAPVPQPAVPPQPAPKADQAPDPAPQPAPANVPPNPAQQKPANPAPQPGQPQVQPAQAQPAVITRPPLQAFVGLSVQDAKDQLLLITDPRAKSRLVNGAYTYEVILTVKPKADQGEPAKLIFTGTRNLTVEVPFKLKDVPLP